MSDSVTIEGGCSYYPELGIYIYRHNTNEGEQLVPFISSIKPKIGDSVRGGVLIPLVGYKINNDPGFQAKR